MSARTLNKEIVIPHYHILHYQRRIHSTKADRAKEYQRLLR